MASKAVHQNTAYGKPAESNPTQTIASASTTIGALRFPIACVINAATGPPTDRSPIVAASYHRAGSGSRNHATVAAAAMSAMTGNPYSSVSKLACVAVIKWTYIVQIAYANTNAVTIRSSPEKSRSNRMCKQPFVQRIQARSAGWLRINPAWSDSDLSKENRLRQPAGCSRDGS